MGQWDMNRKYGTSYLNLNQLPSMSAKMAANEMRFKPMLASTINVQ